MLILLARKESTTESQSGFLNIDTCRIATQDDLGRIQGTGGIGTTTPIAANNGFVSTTHAAGRWPANLLVTVDAVRHSAMDFRFFQTIAEESC